MYNFNVPKEKKIRVIISSDAKNEADDQYAIVHALLTPKFIVRGLIGSHFGNHRTNFSMEASYAECHKILDLMDLTRQIDVYRGAREAINRANEYEYSEGAALIVKEALAQDNRQLFVVCLGPLTDLACAYLAHPEIVGKIIVIWIGGGSFPNGGSEYNLSNDINAANIVFKSDIELWMIPNNVYSRMSVSFAEIEEKVRPYGRIGRYLFDQLIEFNEDISKTVKWTKGESWCLGDSTAVGIMMDPMVFACEMREAPVIDDRMRYHLSGYGRRIRVYNDILTRFVIDDFFAKMKINYGE